jgi:hypothetical protein
MQYATSVAERRDLSLLRREPPTPGEEALQVREEALQAR